MAGARSKIAPISKLSSSFYRNLNTQELARELLGKQLVHIHRGKRYSGIIVETEAYLGVDDPACHTYKNKQTKRTQAMYLPGGHSYIYLIYGMYLCFNVVAKNQGEPEAVLIRALDPRENLTGRTDGPGRLSKAMKFHIRQSGISLGENKIFIENMPRIPDGKIAITSRVGVDYAGEAAHWPLRFYLLDNPHVSKVKLARN